MRKEKATGRHPHHPTRSWAKLPHPRQFDDASAMFRALGEASRLRLLTRLTTGEICVSELAELEDEKLSTISARLKTEAGMVRREPGILQTHHRIDGDAAALARSGSGHGGAYR